MFVLGKKRLLPRELKLSWLHCMVIMWKEEGTRALSEHIFPTRIIVNSSFICNPSLYMSKNIFSGSWYFYIGYVLSLLHFTAIYWILRLLIESETSSLDLSHDSKMIIIIIITISVFIAAFLETAKRSWNENWSYYHVCK